MIISPDASARKSNFSDGKPPMARKASNSKVTIDANTYEIPSHHGPATQAQFQSILKSDSPANAEESQSLYGSKRVSFDADALALAQAQTSQEKKLADEKEAQE